MSNSELNAIDEELRLIRERRDRIFEKRSKLTKRWQQLDRELEDLLVRRRRALVPDEPPGDATVVTFSVTLPSRGRRRVYQYAAIKAGGRWWRTGPTCPSNGETWEQIIRFIQDAESHSTIAVLDAITARRILVPERD